ncbi:phage major capsid protein HK97 [Vitreoscilla sp. C1]|uniref:phage major capsid protein n=1 Tax=Vitreoscilla sp. (strain C1) TaxID=96942 RepID=UPI00159943A6|nr:phage major capsid protein [Vitreoscilla sp. C1]AUZ06350.2 phage major capsid protein HK97 [Vitreoscilla sp. C1]
MQKAMILSAPVTRSVKGMALAMAAGTHVMKRGMVTAPRADSDVAAVLKDMKDSFKAFKEDQDKRIHELEKSAATPADIVAAKKESADLVNALQTTVDDLVLQLAAGQMNGGGRSPEAKANAEAMVAFMRTEEIRADLKKSPDSNGGYLVPTEWDRTITDKLHEISPLRQIFRVVPTSKATFSRLYNLKGTGAGWVGEEDTRGKTNTATFGSLEFATGEMYANPAATQQMLDDAETDLEAWLAEEVQETFSTTENAAFIAGDGAKGKPFGLLTYATGAANATKHPFGAILTINSESAADITADAIIDVVYDLPASFSSGASFIMNRKTLRKVRKMKDGDGNYLWEKSFQAGQPSTILGYPVYEVAEMPDVAANALPIAFGDFKRGYLIVDRKGVVILRDPYTNKPYVQFYTTKRLGGGVDNPEAMRLLKCAVTA